MSRLHGSAGLYCYVGGRMATEESLRALPAGAVTLALDHMTVTKFDPFALDFFRAGVDMHHRTGRSICPAHGTAEARALYESLINTLGLKARERIS